MKITDVFSENTIKAEEIAQPYIIAEAGVNHEGSIEIAKRLIEEAAEAGADAIKFQTYRAETLASKYSPAYWDLSKEPSTNQFELFSKHDKFWKNEMELLKKHCDTSSIEFMSTPFDVESAIFLNDLMSVYKISSSDITNKPFIETICQFNKPIILSTGASHLWEIQQAVDWISKTNNPLALLHCVLNYPTHDDKANLGMILGLKKAFPDLLIGYSDHTLPGDMLNCKIAMLLGSKIIEKHFTHDKNLPGNDHYHAMNKEDLASFVQDLKHIFSVLGRFKVEALPEEDPARLNARRSIVANRDIKSGERIEIQDLTYKRPAYGISPKDIDKLIGKISTRHIKKDEALTWQMISD